LHTLGEVHPILKIFGTTHHQFIANPAQAAHVAKLCPQLSSLEPKPRGENRSCGLWNGGLVRLEQGPLALTGGCGTGRPSISRRVRPKLLRQEGILAADSAGGPQVLSTQGCTLPDGLPRAKELRLTLNSWWWDGLPAVPVHGGDAGMGKHVNRDCTTCSLVDMLELGRDEALQHHKLSLGCVFGLYLFCLFK